MGRNIASTPASSGDRAVNHGAPADVRHWLLAAAFVFVGVAYALVPMQAILWSRRPFAGVLVESTGVVTDYSGSGWGPSVTGLHHPQRVTEVDGRPVKSAEDYDTAMSAVTPARAVQVTTELPHGAENRHTIVPLERFPARDLGRLFWLPYGVGLVYFALGLWVYLAKRDTPAGRAFAIYATATSLALALMFDLGTTHVATPLWTLAMALQGSVLLSLALNCPTPAQSLVRHRWLIYTPYGLSAALGAWGLLALESATNPWAYVTAWRASYAYVAAAIVFFVVRMALLALRPLPETPSSDSGSDVGPHPGPGAREQARVVLMGAFGGFAPIAIWFAAPVFASRMPFSAELFVPPLLLFPLGIAIAVVRYRLWDVQLIINRAIVYGALTLILGSFYVGSILLIEALLARHLSLASPLAVAVSTLGVAALFRPLRGSVQSFIDHRFYRRKYDVAETLAVFDEALQEEFELSHICDRLRLCLGKTVGPAYLELWLSSSEGYRLADPASPTDTLDIAEGDDELPRALRRLTGPVTPGELRVDPNSRDWLRSRDIRLLVPLVTQGKLVGWMGLGPRRSQQSYSFTDRALARDLASRAAPAIRIAQLVETREQEAVERERFDQEMRFAHLVQQTLLPRTTPIIPGWDLAVHWQPARAVGGDFYDLLRLDDGRLAIVIADVADKGIPAALVMASTRPILRGAARWKRPPAEALARANELLLPELPQGMFVTCLYALLDPRTGRLQYANAGHNPPLLRRGPGSHELWATGMALGMLPGVVYEEHETVLEPGDTLLFYSDGLTETRNPNGEMFGLERIRSALEAHEGRPKSLVGALVRELSNYAVDRGPLEDDVTMLALGYRGASEQSDVV